MTVFYLVRTEDTNDYGLNADENLQTMASEKSALEFVVDRMKGSDSKVLDIIKVDFGYNGTKYAPLEITIDRGKFKLTPIPQEAKQK